ncbi:MAG: hypothetical protein SOV41_01570, partial [Oscillospiraceae bacterium]|nr:hypothetical protein [Oscillospiraceae bacterium]
HLIFRIKVRMNAAGNMGCILLPCIIFQMLDAVQFYFPHKTSTPAASKSGSVLERARFQAEHDLAKGQKFHDVPPYFCSRWMAKPPISSLR